MTLEHWLMACGALTCLAAAGAWLRWRRRRHRARQRRLRVLDELDEIGVEQVQGQRADGGRDEEAAQLGDATVLQGRDGLARKGTTFLVVPGSPARWPRTPERPVLLRFARRGVHHELRCRVVGRARRRLPSTAALGAGSKQVLRLAPAGVIVKRERRDMMRFFVGDAEAGKPRGTMDARRFVGLSAWLRETGLDLGDDVRLPATLSMEQVVRSGDADAAEAADGRPAASTAGADPEGLHLYRGGLDPEDGTAVDVIDFSGTGLRVETDLSQIAAWLRLGPEEGAADVLDRLADRALLATVRIKLDFPPRVEDLTPSVPPRTWVLAEVARVSLLETDREDEPDRVRLGLAFLYQIQEADPVTGGPRQWERLPDQGEADDFLALHSSLNQAMAQMQSDAPPPHRK